MHPEICKFPSLHFYNNKLLNGSQMSSKSAPFHQTKGLGPYAFYDIIDGREAHGKNSGAMSLCNEHEADAAVEILRFFKKRYQCSLSLSLSLSPSMFIMIMMTAYKILYATLGTQLNLLVEELALLLHTSVNFLFCGLVFLMHLDLQP
jgi:hypothetical protein